MRAKEIIEIIKERIEFHKKKIKYWQNEMYKEDISDDERGYYEELIFGQILIKTDLEIVLGQIYDKE